MSTRHEIMEAETHRPLGTTAMVICARHIGQEHQHEVVDDESQPGVGKLWRCIDEDEDEPVPTLPYEHGDGAWMGYTPGEDADRAEHPMSERRAWSRY